jgi:hypothetical protein
MLGSCKADKAKKKKKPKLRLGRRARPGPRWKKKERRGYSQSVVSAVGPRRRWLRSFLEYRHTPEQNDRLKADLVACICDQTRMQNTQSPLRQLQTPKLCIWAT